MGFLSTRDASSSLLCEEDMGLLCEEDDMGNIYGCNGNELDLDLPELGMNLDFPTFVGPPSESSDEAVASLMEKEKEQLLSVASGDYLQRLNGGGLELSWRNAAIDWINKAQAHHNFGPLSVYLAVNYFDRFLSLHELPVDQPWMQQLLAVACLTIAAKMEESVVPRFPDFQVCNENYKFDIRGIKAMEIHVLSALKWRMQAVTPFSYINYFVGKFTEGKPLSCGFVSRCTELILGTLGATKFLQFRPSEIAAAVVLSEAAETGVISFSGTLLNSNITIDKENVRRCHEEMQEVGLAKKNIGCSVSPSVTKSPSGKLDTSCLGFKIGDNQTPGSSQANISNNAN
ncbi:hypothetical protein U9M48_007599 [Paspalum notatum var. saurae]|uniref:Cyclin N-terminal domain-containing protein n=1 Tax=Paspalum notatum var. saurae TaxID=547442 RepID=A0AAQ3SMJ9_PASNO